MRGQFFWGGARIKSFWRFYLIYRFFSAEKIFENHLDVHPCLISHIGSQIFAQFRIETRLKNFKDH